MCCAVTIIAMNNGASQTCLVFKQNEWNIHFSAHEQTFRYAKENCKNFPPKNENVQTQNERWDKLHSFLKWKFSNLTWNIFAETISFGTDENSFSTQIVERAHPTFSMYLNYSRIGISESDAMDLNSVLCGFLLKIATNRNCELWFHEKYLLFVIFFFWETNMLLLMQIIQLKAKCVIIKMKAPSALAEASG